MARLPELREAGRTHLVTYAITDYAGLTRGRSISRQDYEEAKGVKTLGWVPANMSLTPFDIIAEPNPWGSRGDLRLLPDPKARFTAWPQGAATPIDMVMSDIVELDGEPWICCPRAFLKSVLADFKTETGLEVIASFEQEFQILDANWPNAPAFSLAALRRADPLGPEIMAALAQAGTEPEVFLSEYGRDQFEVTGAPASGLVAADRCVAAREIIREVARLKGWRATFAPKTAEAGVGNGLHIHFSFRDEKSEPAAYDPGRPQNLSPKAGSFAAGIILYLPALLAVTAPNPVSYLRLKPHHWSASYTWFGERDREASLRICPVTTIGKKDPAQQFNLEFRAADGAANPYLALGVIVRAGLEGVRTQLPSPPIFSGDPEKLSVCERERMGLKRLPASLPAALAEFAEDRIVRGWFAPDAFATYVGMKDTELRLVEGLEGDALCSRYSSVY
jgi:glutamine synthetase